MGGLRKKALTQPQLQSGALGAAAASARAAPPAPLALCFAFLRLGAFLTLGKFAII